MAVPIPLWSRFLIVFIFLVTVCLLAGYVGVALGYPSLFNVKASFFEYAVPLPFTWALAHIPSMLLFGMPLIALPAVEQKYTTYFRIACLGVFLLLLLELDSKIPFLLFPKIDAIVALVFSLILVPPNRRDNPVLVVTLTLIGIAGVIVLGYVAYTTWTHRTPRLVQSDYGDGIFELTAIIVHADFRKEMLFEVDLKRDLSEEQICNEAQDLAGGILRDYPFDDSFNKTIYLTFHVMNGDIIQKPYPLGEISLNNEHRDKNGQYACYVSLK